MSLHRSMLAEFFYRMLRIRRVEERIALLYSQQEMRCPIHLSIGQEAIAVGTCQVLEACDTVISNHRAHAHYLAKGGNLRSMISELYLKVDGCCRGRGGSMHLNDPSVGLIGSVPIVGSSISLAVGMALKAYMKGERAVSLVFLGEAASEEGTFYESVNFAALHKLPVVFVCENNLYSVYSPLSVRVPTTRDSVKLVEALGAKGDRGDGNEVTEVYEKVRLALQFARTGCGPVFLEFSTYRWREHCGPNYDNHIGYRTEEEFEEWKTKDPICRLQRRLEHEGVTAGNFESMEQAITEEIDDAFKFARNSTSPNPSTIEHGVYAD